MHPRTELVPLAAGHVLEVDEYVPADRGAVRTIAMLCHPWSWLGGRKEDPVLVNLAVELAVNHQINVFVPNSRAVGNSTGRSSLSGLAEAKDLEELVRWGVEKIGGVECVLLVGYSYGSLLVSCHPVLPAPIRSYHVLLSYPLSPLPLLTFFHASTYREKLRLLLQGERARVLIMYGDEDQFTAADKYGTWTSGFQSTNEHDPANRLVVKAISGADHFWRGEFNKLMTQTIANWVNQQEQEFRSSS